MSQLIKTSNIANNSVKSFVFDSSVSNAINSASLASAVAISANVAAQAVSTFVTLQSQQVAALPPTINTISITDSSYNIINDNAANTGAYIQITGSNFQSGVIVMVGFSNTALSTTFVDSTTIRAQIPNVAAGLYPLYVVNSNGGTAIRPNGYEASQRFNIFGWGQNIQGNLGLNDVISRSSPTQLASNADWTFALGDVNTHMITKRSNGTLWGTGINSQGNLGLNDNIKRSSPTQIGTDTNWSSISAGQLISFATKTNGTLWGWGYNAAGQLGLNDKINRSSPTQVGVLTDWSKITVAGFSSFAIKNNGTLWVWGSNGTGQLGLNDTAYRSSPVQVGALTNWSKIANGPSATAHTVAIKTDGTLWSWGFNGFGQLATNTVSMRSSPVQVGALTNWSNISSGTYFTLATKTDGTLWSWGYNDFGNLGLNNQVGRSSPVQVGGGTTWLNVQSGYNNVMAITSNGTLWTWGNNTDGQLGLGNAGTSAHKSSPTQVGTSTKWNTIYPSVGYSFVASQKP